MRFFARWVEDALNVTVQRLHDADACKHRWAAVRRDQDRASIAVCHSVAVCSAVGSSVM
jgi:hypothetical protein